MKNNEVCFIICWFGKLPDYFPVWIKTCERNQEYDFLVFTDNRPTIECPLNVKMVPFTKELFLRRVVERIDNKPSLKEAYRLCDYRPLYGIVLKEEIQDYTYWGYCDIDIVFGNISKFLPIEEVKKHEAIFNGGHFTLIKNNQRMNLLFRESGSLFNYKTVVRNHAIFAFDETTGIQSIARENEITAKFGVPYIETESKYRQLRSRLERTNPDYQGFYWENGSLFRVAEIDEEIRYQELVYIHLQKRELRILDNELLESESFWITPFGYANKTVLGIPTKTDIEKYNPFEGPDALSDQERKYKMDKIKQMLRRNPFQIYVRIKQEMAGINSGDGKMMEQEWIKA